MGRKKRCEEQRQRAGPRLEWIQSRRSTERRLTDHNRLSIGFQYSVSMNYGALGTFYVDRVVYVN